MPSNAEIIAGLKSAYEADTSRSLAGRIRVLSAEIAELREGGMSLGSIAAVLTDHGVSVSASRLSYYLWRMRRNRNTASKKASQVSKIQPPSKPVGPTAASNNSEIGKIDPSLIDGDGLAGVSGKRKNRESREDFARQFEQAGVSGALGRLKQLEVKE